MNTIHRGNAAEAAVLAALVAADIPTFLPFGQGAAFDLVAVTPPRGDLVRIQVKSGRIRNGCAEFNSCSTDHGAGRRPYTDRADFIAVHVPDPALLFMVPVAACPSFKGKLRIDEPRNNQRRRVRFAADYLLGEWLARLGPWAVADADRDHLRHPPAERPSPAAGRLRRAAGGG